MLMSTNEHHVLTGAGFTKNFGGFLASEMQSKIFNDAAIQNNPTLRSLLMRDSDFESVFAQVIEGSGYSEIEKKILQDVIERVYFQLDEAIRGWVFNHDNPLAFNIYGLNELFGHCLSNGPKKSFFFTLNQDLLMERHNAYRWPGVPGFSQEFYSLSQRRFEDRFFVRIGSENVVENIEKDIANHGGHSYIKLHGSFGWRASNGSRYMVLGKNKERDIEREPLLQAYLELFKKTLQEGNKKLLVVGYGFRDQHINKILAKSVEDYGLQLFIITTTSMAGFNNVFDREGHYYAKSILDGVRGYFPYSFKEIFPTDQSRSEHFKEIVKSLTGRVLSD